MDDLITWLRAQIDEDEREQAGVIERVGRALAAADLETFPGAYEARKEYYDGLAEAALKAAGFDLARVLREVEAKRRIIDDIVPWIEKMDRAELERVRAYVGLADKLLRRLALPFSDRPGYREEWRPL